MRNSGKIFSLKVLSAEKAIDQIDIYLTSVMIDIPRAVLIVVT